LRIALSLLAAVLLAASSASTSTANLNSGAAAESATIAFDPPVDKPLRYRWEKTVAGDGKSTTHWSVDEYRFQPSEDGYKLSVSPVSTGTNESDPQRLAFMKKLSDLTRFPFVLNVNEDAEIVALERADEVWAMLFKTLRNHVADRSKAGSPEVKAVEAVIAAYERMPAETRLAHLTETVKPLLEFASTKTTVGEPMVAKLEAASPFGTVHHDVAVTLNRVTNGVAHLSLRASLPRADFDKIMRGVLDGVASQAMAPAELAKLKAQFSGLEDYRHETQAEYEVSVKDGILERLRSTETVELTFEGKSERRVTTRSLSRIR
jgi:hypothetical protein